jgi:hypothetical protein
MPVISLTKLGRLNMRKAFVAVAMVATLSFAATAKAQLAYSFEAPPVNPDGFGPNGGGVTIAQDTVGATQGTNSMKVSVVTGATFVGALSTVVPVTPGGAVLNNPPGVDSVLFDMTIGPNDAFTGAFDVVGITIFGSNVPLGQFGLQAQFAPLIHVEGKAAGQYLNQSIPLTGATNPLNFAANQTFNQIFTAGVPDANHLNVSGFEFFINKSNDAPTTIYIDNVRLVASVPEPATLGMFSLGAVGLGFVSRRRRG